MTLEEQLAALAEIGIHPNDEVEIADFLRSAARERYEDRPFAFLLLVLGAEVEGETEAHTGLRFCDAIWSFPDRCVVTEAAYIDIAEEIAKVAGAELVSIDSNLDFEAKQGHLKYDTGSKRAELEVHVHGAEIDWMTVTRLFEDLSSDSHTFYGLKEGGHTTLLFLDNPTQKKLNRLLEGALEPMLA